MTGYQLDITGQRIELPQWTCDSDPVWVEVRPNLRRIHVLAGDILAALGKRRDVGGKGRNESEDVHLAAAWLRAHQCPDLIIVEAQRLHPRILNSLTHLTERARVDLHLLHRPPINDATHRKLMRYSEGEIDVDDLPRPTPAAPTSEPVRDPVAVPSHDFHVYIAAVRAHLDPANAAGVIEEFAATSCAVRGRLQQSQDPPRQLAAELTKVVIEAPPQPKLVTQVRAIQRAAWDFDLHISVDLPMLLHSQERPRTPAHDAGPLLMTYRQPYRAVTWLLAHHNIGVTDAPAIPLSAVVEDGTTVDTPVGPIDVTETLAPALRAQVALRLGEGANPEDALLPYAPKTLANALSTASLDLGLAAHGRLTERHSPDVLRWLRRLGITIRPLP